MGFTGAHVLHKLDVFILALYLLSHGCALLKYTCKTSSINPHLVTVLHEWLQPAHGRPVPPWQLSRVNWSASSQAAALTTESPSSSSASPSSSFGRGQIFFAKPSRTNIRPSYLVQANIFPPYCVWTCRLCRLRSPCCCCVAAAEEL